MNTLQTTILQPTFTELADAEHCATEAAERHGAAVIVSVDAKGYRVIPAATAAECMSLAGDLRATADFISLVLPFKEEA